MLGAASSCGVVWIPLLIIFHPPLLRKRAEKSMLSSSAHASLALSKGERMPKWSNSLAIIRAGSVAFALNILVTSGTAETFLEEMFADWVAKGAVDFIGPVGHA